MRGHERTCPDVTLLVSRGSRKIAFLVSARQCVLNHWILLLKSVDSRFVIGCLQNSKLYPVWSKKGRLVTSFLNNSFDYFWLAQSENFHVGEFIKLVYCKKLKIQINWSRDHSWLTVIIIIYLWRALIFPQPYQSDEISLITPNKRWIRQSI